MQLIIKPSIICLLVFTICLSGDLISQEVVNNKVKAHEFGLRFSGFDDFNLMYKRELKSGLIRRHRFLFSNFLYNSTGSTIDFRTGYAIGHEKRKKMNEVFSFIHGPEVALVINYQNIRVPNDDRVTTVILQPSFGYIIGFQYDINEHFYISVEVIAALSGSVQLREMQDTSYTLNAGFNSNSSALTLVYRFNS